nr:endonuclease/exonuclease/phosphatase family protein [Fredinandcohnia onubensis]
MKIVSWNCQQGFINKDKYKKLLNLEPDIVVVQECASPSSFGQDFKYEDVIWKGNNENKGLCVVSFSKNLKLSVLKDFTSEWIVPILVSGEKNFILIAVWTIKQPTQSYGMTLLSALKEYADLYQNNDVVIIGDFNVDQRLRSSYRGTKGLEEISGFLNNYGIFSAYHYLTNEKFSEETKPTYFHQRKPQNPFYIDYCFVSEKLLNKETIFSIGEGEEWVKYSDHFPLVLETKF